jgi:hypothetical protein
MGQGIVQCLISQEIKQVTYQLGPIKARIKRCPGPFCAFDLKDHWQPALTELIKSPTHPIPRFQW